MAQVITFLAGAASFTTASGSKTTSSTLGIGNLIVLVTAHSGNTSATAPTDDNPGGAGTYVRVATATAQSGVDTLSIWVRTALVTNGSSTVFTHACGTSTGGGIFAYKVTGMSKVGAAAVLQSAVQSNQGAGGTPTPVLGAAANTNNALLGAVMNASNPATLTPRTSPAWTEGGDAGYNTPTTGCEVMAISSGETATSIAWGGTSATAFGALVIELDGSTSVALTGQSVSVARGSVLQGAPITGQAVAAAQGSASLATAMAVTGQAVSAACGTLVPAVSFAISGQALSAANGQVLQGAPLVGQSLAAAQGSLTAVVTFALVGQSVTIARGSIAPTASAGVSGQSAVVGQGSVDASPSLALTGQASTVSRESLLATTSLAPSGQALTVARGTVTVDASEVTAALTGQSLTAAQGTVSPAFSATLAGQSLIAGQGIAAPSTSSTLLGSTAAVSRGDVVASANEVTAVLTGMATSLAQESVTAQLVADLAGAGLTVARGDLDTSGGQYPLAGVPLHHPNEGVNQDHPLTDAQAFPVTASQTYPLEHVSQHYPLAA